MTEEEVTAENIKREEEKTRGLKLAETFLKKDPVQFMAAVNVGGKAALWPLKCRLIKNQKFWFCADANDEICIRFKRNPFAELGGQLSDGNWIRISGMVHFTDNDTASRNEIMKTDPVLSKKYGSADNEDFAVFCFENAMVIMPDGSKYRTDYRPL